MHIRSYPKIHNLGNPQADGILDGNVLVQSKSDGSQISFGVLDGELYMKSKRAELFDGANSMFQAGIDTIKFLKDKLTPGWIYRGEYFSKPKHNCLAYNRIPRNHIVLFDIEIDESRFLPYEDVVTETSKLGLEVIPLLYSGKIDDVEQIKEWLKLEDFLGGPTIEGVVIKDYTKFGPDGKVLMAKYVSEAFKEKNRSNFRNENPSGKDIIVELGIQLRNENRWAKSIQRLQEEGKLENSPRDIGMLMKEIQQDILVEESDYIKEKLFKHAWKHIARKSIAGFAEYYKEKLLEKAFEDGD